MNSLRMVLIAVVLAAAATGFAGERTSVRGMGMARSHAASARGLDAIGVNPANLAYPEFGVVTISLLPAAFHVGSEVLDYDLYRKYFTGVDSDSGRVARFLEEEDKARILNAFGEDEGETRLDVDMRLAALSLRLSDVGVFGFTVTEQASGVARLSRDYVEFLMNGNTPGSRYELGPTTATGLWTREYALSFGTALPHPVFLRSAAAGVTVKLVHGYGCYQISRFNTTMVTGADGTLAGTIDFLSRYAGVTPYESNFTLFPAPVGSGFGVDLGVAGAVNHYFSFGLSVTDVGSLRWSRGLTESFADTTLMIDDPLQTAQRDAIERTIKGEKRDGTTFSTPLPTCLHLGFAVDLGAATGGNPGRILVELDYDKGLVETPRTTLRSRVSVGAEYKPLAWLPLRTGLSFGGTDRMNLAFGVGVDFEVFEVSVASENVTWLAEPGSFSYSSLALGTRFRF